MAQIQEQPIMLANRGVGKVSINGGGIRGEGGALHPQLVVPLKFDLSNFPEEAMLAVYRVKATLAAEQHPFPGNALCRPTAEDLIDNLPVHSLPQGDISRSVDLRFWATSAEVENIETIRHKSPTSTFVLHVAVEAGIAWVKTYNQMSQTAQPDSPWEMNFGMFSQLYPFWTCRIATIQVEIDQSHWIDNVLPGLGYDRLRLLELTFPPTLPDHPNAVAQFDQARKALDQRRYGDCIPPAVDCSRCGRSNTARTPNNASQTSWQLTGSGRKEIFADDCWTRSGKRSSTSPTLPITPRGRSPQRFLTEETPGCSSC